VKVVSPAESNSVMDYEPASMPQGEDRVAVKMDHTKPSATDAPLGLGSPALRRS
jgi:hypothetical protein